MALHGANSENIVDFCLVYTSLHVRRGGVGARGHITEQWFNDTPRQQAWVVGAMLVKDGKNERMVQETKTAKDNGDDGEKSAKYSCNLTTKVVS